MVTSRTTPAASLNCESRYGLATVERHVLCVAVVVSCRSTSWPSTSCPPLVSRTAAAPSHPLPLAGRKTSQSPSLMPPPVTLSVVTMSTTIWLGEMWICGGDGGGEGGGGAGGGEGGGGEGGGGEGGGEGGKEGGGEKGGTLGGGVLGSGGGGSGAAPGGHGGLPGGGTDGGLAGGSPGSGGDGGGRAGGGGDGGNLCRPPQSVQSVP